MCTQVSSSAAPGAAARAELGLEDDYYSTSAGQRERMLASTERLNKTGTRIQQGQQQLLETEVGGQQGQPCRGWDVVWVHGIAGCSLMQQSPGLCLGKLDGASLSRSIAPGQQWLMSASNGGRLARSCWGALPH